MDGLRRLSSTAAEFESGFANGENVSTGYLNHSVTHKDVDILDGLSCYQNFDCKHHDASDLIESNIQERDIVVIDTVVEKYLKNRLVSQYDRDDNQLDQIALTEDERSFLDKLKHTLTQPGVFKQCGAFLDGFSEGVRMFLDDSSLCDKACRSDSQPMSSVRVSSNNLKRASDGASNDGSPSKKPLIDS